MRKVNLTPARQQRFIKALSKTGSVTKAAALAGTSRTRVYELRKIDPAFATAREDAEESPPTGLRTRRDDVPWRECQNHW